MSSIDEILEDGDYRKTRAIDSLKRDMGTIRTGRPHPSILDGISIDYYGTSTPLNQLASISVAEGTQLVIQPWDPQSLNAIEKAILGSDIGLNPMSDGSVIRLLIPQLTGERRKELVRGVRKHVEDGKVGVRNIRRDLLEKFRGLEKNKEISQDESRRAQDQLQKMTDRYVDQMEGIGTEKEQEVREF